MNEERRMTKEYIYIDLDCIRELVKAIAERKEE